MILLPGSGSAAGETPADFDTSTPVPLQLEVSINGAPTGLIGAFLAWPDGRLTAAASELAEIGIDPMGASGDNETVSLDTLPGVAYSYDEAQQSINFTAPDAARIRKEYDARGGVGQPLDPVGYGSVLNYGLFAGASSGRDYALDGIGFNGASATLDHIVYSPAGTLANGWIVGENLSGDLPVLRLDSTWTTTFREQMTVAAVGDIVSGGLAWTRPIRLGGVQVRRNFGVRPDLVTMPLPSFSGSAAVPSTVDVYVNNVRAFSQDVTGGPFLLNNVPVAAGSGEARVVVRDASGRESETISTFSTSPDLLREGLMDFSVEAGFARRGYGVRSFDYEESPVAVASMRYGMTNRFTAAAHGEAGGGLLNASAGGILSLGQAGTLEGAVSGSLLDGKSGFQLMGQYEGGIGPLSITLSSQRAFGSYRDLAYVASLSPGLSEDEIISLRPNLATDRIGLGMALPDGRGSLAANVLHIEDSEGQHSFFLSSNYTRGLWNGATLSFSAYVSLDGRNNAGASLDLSFPFGIYGYASVSGSGDSGGARASASISRPQNGGDGSVGWHARVSAGDSASAEGRLDYQHRYADVELTAGIDSHQADASLYAEGALVAADGGLYLSRRIDEAFAIVDAGAPDVEVMIENAPAGRTGRSGKLLVPGLRAYDENRIALSTDDLPVNADYESVEKLVTPSDTGGVSIGFGVRRDLTPALVSFKDAEGHFIKAGSRGTVAATGEHFTVGFGGEAWIKRLAEENQVTLETEAGLCTAKFTYTPGTSVQDYIEEVVCS